MQCKQAKLNSILNRLRRKVTARPAEGQSEKTQGFFLLLLNQKLKI
jgi:hypothetical protein